MMLTSDVPYSDPSHNHNAPSHGMQTHQSLFTKKNSTKSWHGKIDLLQQCCVVAEHFQLRGRVSMACRWDESARICLRVRTGGGGGKSMVARAWGDRSGGVGSFVGGDSAVARVGGAAVMVSDAMMACVGGAAVMASDDRGWCRCALARAHGQKVGRKVVDRATTGD